MRKIILVLIVIYSISCAPPAATIRELGQPVQTALCWNKGLIPRPSGIPGSDLWLVSYNPAGSECIRYNPDTGEMKKWALKGTTEIWPAFRATDGNLYMGGRGPMVYRINAKSDDLDILGPSPSKSFVRSMTEGSDGKIYGGGIEGDSIWRFDPRTGAFEDLGSLRIGVTYAAAMHAMPGGHIFAGFGMPARLVHLKIGSGERRQILDQKYFDDSFVYGFFSGGSYLYAYLWPSGRYLVYDVSGGKWIREIASPSPHNVYQVKRVDADGLLYLGLKDSETTLVYDPRRDTLESRKDVSLPGPYARITVSSEGRISQMNEDGAVLRELAAPFSKSLEKIFAMGIGPDGKIYSDGFQVLHLFVTDPETGTSRDLGPLDTSASGETYSFAHDSRYLYIAKYTEGGVYRYDPSLPYRPTRQAADANPRWLCSLHMPVYRPAFNCWGPDGLLWFAGYAGWGWKGCGIAWMDTQTGEFDAAHLPDSQIKGIAAFPPDRVAIAAEKSLLIWNARTKRQEDALAIPADTVATDATGLVWVGAADSVRAFSWKGKPLEVGNWTCAAGRIRELVTAPDGCVYGLAGEALIRIPKGGGEPVKIADCPADAVHLAAGENEKFYFARGTNLYELDL